LVFNHPPIWNPSLTKQRTRDRANVFVAGCGTPGPAALPSRRAQKAVRAAGGGGVIWLSRAMLAAGSCVKCERSITPRTLISTLSPARSGAGQLMRGSSDGRRFPHPPLVRFVDFVAGILAPFHASGCANANGNSVDPIAAVLARRCVRPALYSIRLRKRHGGYAPQTALPAAAPRPCDAGRLRLQTWLVT
jgi:hypothetical protein